MHQKLFPNGEKKRNLQVTTRTQSNRNYCQIRTLIYYLSIVIIGTMEYVISTEVNDVLYCIKTNAEKKKFELQPIYGIADFKRAFICPNHSVAVMFQNWINKNDQFLARHNLQVSPAAKYR
jgi:hypothetical protein